MMMLAEQEQEAWSNLSVQNWVIPVCLGQAANGSDPSSTILVYAINCLIFFLRVFLDVNKIISLSHLSQ